MIKNLTLSLRILPIKSSRFTSFLLALVHSVVIIYSVSSLSTIEKLHFALFCTKGLGKSSTLLLKL